MQGKSRYWRLLAILGVLALPLLNPTHTPAAAQGMNRTFPETGKTVSGQFLQYWAQHGGLAQQGYPISDEFNEVSPLDGKQYRVQYFERAVFEYHPENHDPNKVLLSQLGTFLYGARYSADGQPLATPGGGPPLPQDNFAQAQVTRVVDGDTIEVSIGGTLYRVRYIGIDTPETVAPDRPVGCYGPEASAANKALVEGKTVTLEKDVSDVDQYGRLLRYVYVGSTFVNAELVRQGGCVLTTVFSADQETLRARGLRGGNFEVRASSSLLERLVDVVKSGKLTVPIDSTISLAEAPAAIARSRAGHSKGKTVIVP